ncbi:MAG TPA: SAM-dependent methyltransferase, partial [Ktedonobacterales bacterium]|nr:SAM-dependent methyltransferase [Ktedonobacterales bacterium]
MAKRATAHTTTSKSAPSARQQAAQPEGSPAPAIVVVGLGPGRWDDLTIEARSTLDRATSIICRTTRHPTVDALRLRRPGLTIESFDALYETADSFGDLYPAMARRLLDLAVSSSEQPIIYAVPGHPLIGEESVRLLRAQATERGVRVRQIAGLSFVESVCAALDLNPLERNLQLVDATLLAETPAPALMGALLPTCPTLVAQVYNRRLASGAKLALSELYPDDWEVTLVRWAGLTDDERIERLPLYALDR